MGGVIGGARAAAWIERVDESERGFRVTAHGGAAAEIRLRAWRLEGAAGSYRLFEARPLALDLLWHLAGGFPSYREANRDRRLVQVVRLVEQQAERLFSPLQRRAAAVQRAVFRASRTTPALCESDLLYQDRWITADVLRYPAAAVALGWVDRVLEERRAAQGGVARPLEEEELLAAMANWRGLLSPTRVPYRSLNRTLMNLPLRRLDHLHALRRFHLSRPITNWLVLTALTAWLSLGRLEDELFRERARLIHESSPASIAAAITRLGEHTRRRLSPNRVEDVAFAMSIVGDLRDRHSGRLSSLVAKTIRWHERFRTRLLPAPASPEERAVRTARPPRPLPELEGIRFLSTVGDLADESVLMNHCVASYADDAVRGSSFLFHVELDGEHATVEVTADGDVRQAVGPGNERNLAATWGRKRLQEWFAGRVVPCALANAPVTREKSALGTPS